MNIPDIQHAALSPHLTACDFCGDLSLHLLVENGVEVLTADNAHTRTDIHKETQNVALATPGMSVKHVSEKFTAVNLEYRHCFM